MDAGQTCDPAGQLESMQSLCLYVGDSVSPHSCSSPQWYSRFLLSVKKLFWNSLNLTERNVSKTNNPQLELCQGLLKLIVCVLSPASPLLSLFIDERSQQLVTGCAGGQVRAPWFPDISD